MVYLCIQITLSMLTCLGLSSADLIQYGSQVSKKCGLLFILIVFHIIFTKSVAYSVMTAFTAIFYVKWPNSSQTLYRIIFLVWQMYLPSYLSYCMWKIPYVNMKIFILTPRWFLVWCKTKNKFQTLAFYVPKNLILDININSYLKLI